MNSIIDTPESRPEPPQAERLPLAIRRLNFTVTLPKALLRGCAHHPAAPTELTSTSQGKRIFRLALPFTRRPAPLKHYPANPVEAQRKPNKTHGLTNISLEPLSQYEYRAHLHHQ